MSKIQNRNIVSKEIAKAIETKVSDARDNLVEAIVECSENETDRNVLAGELKEASFCLDEAMDLLYGR